MHCKIKMYSFIQSTVFLEHLLCSYVVMYYARPSEHGDLEFRSSQPCAEYK